MLDGIPGALHTRTMSETDSSFWGVRASCGRMAWGNGKSMGVDKEDGLLNGETISNKEVKRLARSRVPSLF